jgi:hypothetical protein
MANPRPDASSGRLDVADGIIMGSLETMAKAVQAPEYQSSHLGSSSLDRNDVWHLDISNYPSKFSCCLPRIHCVLVIFVHTCSCNLLSIVIPSFVLVIFVHACSLNLLSIVIPSCWVYTLSNYYLRYMTPFTISIHLIIRLFYKYFCKSINLQVKSKVHLTIDIRIHILL